MRSEGVSIDRIESGFDRKIEYLGIRIKDVNQLKVRQDVFDEVTFLALYRMVHKGWITAIGGSISTGKEANVFFGERDDCRIWQSRFTVSVPQTSTL